MRLHGLDETEVQVFHFWIDRLQREYRDPTTSVATNEKSSKINLRLLRGVNYGKDQDEFWVPRANL